MSKQVNRWIPIAIFYVIAVAIRAISLKMGRSDVADITYFLKAWAQGAGPCIGALWFLWHVHISFSWGGLIFLAILIFGAWGIGRIADDTRSLVACACFHTLYNFSTHGFFEFSPAVICLYVGIIASWFVIWYVPWDKWARNLLGSR